MKQIATVNLRHIISGHAFLITRESDKHSTRLPEVDLVSALGGIEYGV